MTTSTKAERTALKGYEQDREARAHFRKTKGAGEVHHRALLQARADRSDPFAYARVRGEMESGLGESLSGWEASFRNEERRVLVGNRTIEHQVEMPHSVKRY